MENILYFTNGFNTMLNVIFIYLLIADWSNWIIEIDCWLLYTYIYIYITCYHYNILINICIYNRIFMSVLKLLLLMMMNMMTLLLPDVIWSDLMRYLMLFTYTHAIHTIHTLKPIIIPNIKQQYINQQSLVSLETYEHKIKWSEYHHHVLVFTLL